LIERLEPVFVEMVNWIQPTQLSEMTC